MALEDRIMVMATIGNHDESTGTAVDAVSAAVIIADKTDVRRAAEMLGAKFKLKVNGSKVL